MEPELHCMNCGEEGDEEHFTPTDGSPEPRVCPECGSVQIFEL